MSFRVVAIALVISVAVNLAMVGFFIGRQSGPGVHFDPARGYPRWVKTLPEARQDELRPVIRQHFRRGTVSRSDLRAQHEAFRTAVAAEPFSADDLSDILAAMRGRHAAAQQQSHAAFVDFVLRLTPEERRRLAEDLGGPHGFKGRHSPRPPREQRQ